MFKFFVAAWALLLGTPAHAADWWYVGYTGSGKNEVVHFIDMGSITSSLTKKKYWTFFINETLSNSGIRKEKQLWEADCTQRTLEILSYVEYGNNNVIIKSKTFPYYSGQADYAVPDSIGETKLNLVCLGTEEGARALPENMTPEEASVIVFKD